MLHATRRFRRYDDVFAMLFFARRYADMMRVAAQYAPTI